MATFGNIFDCFCCHFSLSSHLKFRPRDPAAKDRPDQCRGTRECAKASGPARGRVASGVLFSRRPTFRCEMLVRETRLVRELPTVGVLPTRIAVRLRARAQADAKFGDAFDSKCVTSASVRENALYIICGAVAVSAENRPREMRKS